MLRTQGHGLTMEDLCAMWVCGRHRSAMPKDSSGEAADTAADAGCSTEAPKKKRKTAFSSNSWHLWCRRFCSGQAGQKRDWAAASREWKKLDPKSKEAFAKETREAKAKARAFGKQPGESIFGAKQSRLLSKALRKATAVGGALGRDQPAHAEMTDPSLSILEAQLEKLPASITLDSLHKQAMKEERKGWGKKQAADRLAESAIQTWLESQHSLSDLSQQLAGSNSSLQHRPGAFPDGGVLAVHEGDRGLGAIRLVSYLHESKSSTNLGDALVNSFALKCRTMTPDALVSEHRLEDQQEPEPKKKKPPCYEAGICLCSPPGCRLWLLLCRLLDTIKRAFPRQGSLRSTLLKQSGVFVLLRGYPQADANAEELQVKEAKIWHIGIQYLVPFRPTFRECTALDTNFNAETMAVEAGLLLS